MRGEYNMRESVNIKDWLLHLEGDVMVDEVYEIVDAAQVRDYHGSKPGELVRRDYTVAIWSHDGISCVDVWITKNGCVETYADIDNTDDLFMALYTTPHASLRVDTWGIPGALRDAFLANATQRMEWEE
jgi:hypothetical protein